MVMIVSDEVFPGWDDYSVFMISSDFVYGIILNRCSFCG